MKKLLMQLWQYTPMLLILLVSTITYIKVQNYLFTTDNKIQIDSVKHEPLYIMKNAIFNDESLSKHYINYKIKAAQAIQFEDDKTFVLNNIEITSYKNEQNTIITANTGLIDANFDSINLNKANIDSIKNFQKTNLKSEQMIFYPRIDQIISKERTYIVQKKNNISNYLNSDKIIFNNINHNINLQGKVQGIFSNK